MAGLSDVRSGNKMRPGGLTPPLPRKTEISGQPHHLAYITPGEADLLVDNGGGRRNGRQVYGPYSVPAYPDGPNDGDPSGGSTGGSGGGNGGGGPGGGATDGSPAADGTGVAGGGAPSGTDGSSTDGSPAADGTGIAGGHAPTGTTGPVGHAPGSLNDILDRAVRAVTRVDMLNYAEKAFAEINQDVRDRGISVTDGRGYSGPEGSPEGPAFGGGDQGNDQGGSEEPPIAPDIDTDDDGSDDGGSGRNRPPAFPSDWNEAGFLAAHPDVAQSVSDGIWESGHAFNRAWRKFSGQDYGTAPAGDQARNAYAYRDDFMATPRSGVMPNRGYFPDYRGPYG